MNRMTAWEKGALAALLILELWAFSGAFSKFFNHDSFFYLVYYPKSAGELARYFSAPDSGQQYRPLTLAFAGAVVPLLGTEARLYHWIPLLFHLLNTLLFYMLAKRLLSGSIAATAASTFWGLHAVSGWITYDLGYVSDFLSAFLLLSMLLLAIEGVARGARLPVFGALLLFVLALLTKESATTFPLALWIALGLAELRRAEEPHSWGQVLDAFRKPAAVVAAFLGLAILHAGLLWHWLRSGLLYAQGGSAAYDINFWSNLPGKLKYLFWALNLPDALHIANASRNRALAVGLLGFLFLVWAIDIMKRKGRLTAAEWGGLVWFAGLSLPALMLSSRLAKWYLYTPLLGLSLTAGILVESSSRWLVRRRQQIAIPAALCLCTIPVLYSGAVQTRSFLARSDASYNSDVLRSFVDDFRKIFPVLPANTTLMVLPAFEEAAALLSAQPIDRGELFGVYYPGSKVRIRFAHRGERLAPGELKSPDTRVVHFLDGRIHDVTPYYRESGRMTLHVLPTPEGVIPPLFLKKPQGGTGLYDKHVRLSIGDEGGRLPPDYLERSDIWTLQYMNGHFSDVTPLLLRKAPTTAILLPTLDGRIPPLGPIESDPSMGRLKSARVRLVSADASGRLPAEILSNHDARVYQYLDGEYREVTHYLGRTGRMSLFLLPTREGAVPASLRRDPASRCEDCNSPVQRIFADEGGSLPPDFPERSDIWVLQYMSGNFQDVTDYYRGRRGRPGYRVIKTLDELRCTVSREEFYPDYSRFSTPNGRPVFFPAPGTEIITQIGGSTVSIPVPRIPPASALRCDVSWMYGTGDGAWAEMVLRADGREKSLFRQYMNPGKGGKAMRWEEIRIDLSEFANREIELLLKCTNDPGKNTVSDWLNWRDIVIESGAPGSLPPAIGR